MNDVKDIEITGVKIKGGLFCHYSFTQEIGSDVHEAVQVKSERPIHDDLKNAFTALIVHMPLILMDLQPGDIADVNSSINGYEGKEGIVEILERFKLSEVVFDMEELSVSLIGSKHLDLGSLPIATPFVRFEGDYHYSLELRMHCDELVKEVRLYIDGKQAPIMVQTDMFLDEDPDEQPKEEAPKKKRGRPKKQADPEEETPRIGLSLEEQNAGNVENEPLTAFYNPEL